MSTSEIKLTGLRSLVQCLKLDVNPLANPPEDLFDCLDKALLQTSNDTPPRLQLHLLTAIPSMVMFHLERDTVVTSLDKFGAGASSNLASQRQPFRPIKKRDDTTSATEQEEEEQQLLWLDRYWVRNRVKIAKGRTEMAALQISLDEAKKKRREVAMTPDGKDARQLVRRTVEYLEKATSGGDPAREERQKRLREQWSRVADELDNVVNGMSAPVFSSSSRFLTCRLIVSQTTMPRSPPSMNAATPSFPDRTCTRSVLTASPRSSCGTASTEEEPRGPSSATTKRVGGGACWIRAKSRRRWRRR